MLGEHHPDAETLLTMSGVGTQTRVKKREKKKNQKTFHFGQCKNE